MEQKPENNHVKSVEQDLCIACIISSTMPAVLSPKRERSHLKESSQWERESGVRNQLPQPFRALKKESISLSPFPETGKAEMYGDDQEQRRTTSISHTAGVTGYQWLTQQTTTTVFATKESNSQHSQRDPPVDFTSFCPTGIQVDSFFWDWIWSYILSLACITGLTRNLHVPGSTPITGLHCQ